MQEKREQALYFPAEMLEAIQGHAVRADKSLSYIVQFAWKTAGAQISAMTEEALRALVAPYADSDKQKQSLYFPLDMLEAMVAESVRIDSSLSLIAQSAFILATDQIAALQASSAGEPD